VASKRPIVCAHRGASGTHPENTPLAFDEAVRLGVEMIEFDVRRTRDGRFVIIHDANVDRTTDGSGMIDDMTLDQVRRFDAGAGQCIPTLDEAMAYADRVWLNVHGKAFTDEDAEAMAEALVQYFKEGVGYDRAFIASEEFPLLQHVRRRDERMRVCPLFDQVQDQYISRTSGRIRCDVFQPRNTIVTPELVAEAHALGAKVNPFYADDEPEMRRLIDCGVDGILTNFPHRLIALRDQG
jgi:glycerophosphoryl diester phosphodiesterase